MLVPRLASMATQNAVSKRVEFFSTISGISSSSSRSPVIGRQISPRPCFAMKLIASGVTFSAAMVRSPSFSRSSSSTTMTISPRRIAATASSTAANGPDERAPFAILICGLLCHCYCFRNSIVRTMYLPIMSHSRLTLSPLRRPLQRGVAPGVRNHHHVELPLAQTGDRQADAVDRHRALADEIRRQDRLKPNRQPPRLALGPDLFDDADPVDVSKHEMAVDAAVAAHRAFEIHFLAALQRRQTS